MVALASIGVAVLPGDFIGGQYLPLLWAWAVGAATGLHVVPWAKQAVAP